MFRYIKAALKVLTGKETVENALFAIDIARKLFTGPDGRDLEKNEALLRKLEIAQQQIDRLQQFIPNRETELYVEGINNDFRPHEFGDFSAKLVKNKHGDGKDGIDLGLKGKVAGQDVTLGYDPSDGSARFGIGPFKINI